MSKRFNARLVQALYLRQTGFRDHLVAILVGVKNGNWEDEDWLRDMISVLGTPLEWVSSSPFHESLIMANGLLRQLTTQKAISRSEVQEACRQEADHD